MRSGSGGVPSGARPGPTRVRRPGRPPGRRTAAPPPDASSPRACCGPSPIGAAPMSDAKQVALDWVDRNAADLSDWTKTIWDFAEPAFREYRSAAWYVRTLEDAGFTVEAG